MSAAAAEVTLASELWLSLQGLVRAYAASAGLNASFPVEAAAAEDAITVSAGAAELEIRIGGAGGNGEWDLRSAGAVRLHGNFALLPEGRIELDGVEMELDHAAIDLVALLMKKAAGRTS